MTTEHPVETLLREKRHRFVKLAQRYAPKGVDPEDCVQDAAILALRFAKDFEGRSQFSSWFGRIVINRAILCGRRMKKDVSLDTSIGEGIKFWEMFEAKTQSPFDSLKHKELIGKFKQLPPGFRRIMELTYVDGKDLKEIAADMGIAVGSVKAGRSRGAWHVRKRLGL